ncbi:MFS transporter [Caldalkalibacillus salinus]|uniref:MFS transporter n=1 Tax=Caldalkalibacillus salinus TaxID=2803787 RepID=UPI001922039C
MTVIHDWIKQIKGYNRNVRLFLWANVLFQVGMGMFMIMYNLYVKALGFDQTVIGNMVAMQSLAAAIILIPAGILSDQLGRKKIIAVGLLFTVVSFVLRAILEVETGLILTAFMTGLFSSFIQVSAIPLLSENSTKEQRVHLFSLNFALMMVANVIGNMGGGALADVLHLWFGMTELISLRTTLLIGTGMSFLAFLPISMLQEKGKVKQHKTLTSMLTKGNLKRALVQHHTSIKIIGLFAVAQMLIGFGAGLVIPYLNVYFADRFQASNTSIGLVVSLGQAATAVAMLIGPAIVKRIGEVRAVVVLQLLSIPFLLLTGFTNNFYLASVGFLFRQALMNAGNPIQMSVMMDKVDDNMKGLANSVGQTIFMLGWACMGPVSSYIVSRYGAYWGYAYVFSLTAALYIVGSVYFYYVFYRRPDKVLDSKQKIPL